MATINNYFSADLLYQLFFSQMRLKEIASVDLVCKKWHEALINNAAAVFKKYCPLAVYTDQPLFLGIQQQLRVQTGENLKAGICSVWTSEKVFGKVFSIRLDKEDRLILGKENGKIEIWRLNSREAERTISTKEKRVLCLELNRKMVYVAGSRGRLLCHTLQNGNLMDEVKFTPKKKTIVALALNRKENLMAVGDDSEFVEVWDLKVKTCVKRFFQVHAIPNKKLVFSVDGGKLLSRSLGNIVYAWDMKTDKDEIIERGILNENGDFKKCYMKDKGVWRIVALQTFHFGYAAAIRTNFTKLLWKGLELFDRNSPVQQSPTMARHRDEIACASFERDGRLVVYGHDKRIQILDFNPEWSKH